MMWTVTKRRCKGNCILSFDWSFIIMIAIALGIIYRVNNLGFINRLSNHDVDLYLQVICGFITDIWNKFSTTDNNSFMQKKDKLFICPGNT
jgi:hypothetical protein